MTATAERIEWEVEEVPQGKVYSSPCRRFRIFPSGSFHFLEAAGKTVLDKASLDNCKQAADRMFSANGQRPKPESNGVPIDPDEDFDDEEDPDEDLKCPCGSGLKPVNVGLDLSKPTWACEDCFEKVMQPEPDPRAPEPAPEVATCIAEASKAIDAGDQEAAAAALDKAAEYIIENAAKVAAPPSLRPGNANAGSAPVKSEPPKIDKQAILDDLVFKHGGNFTAWASYAEILLAAGLTPGDVTPAMLRKADDNVRRQIVADFKNEPKRQGPKQFPLQALKDGAVFRTPEPHSLEGRIVERNDSEVKVAVQRGNGKTNEERWALGTMVIPGRAKVQEPEPEAIQAPPAPDTIPEAAAPPQVEENATMIVYETQARKLFSLMGKQDQAEDLTVNGLAKRFNDPAKLIAGAGEIPAGNDEYVSILDKVAKTVEKGGKVEIKEGAPPEDNGQAKHKETKANPDKGKKAAGKPKAEKKEPKEKTEVDEFGSRKGTMVAAVNAAIGKRPQTVEQIMEKAGITDKGKYKNNHLKFLLNNKFIKKEDGKFFRP